MIKTMVSCRFSLKPIHWLMWGVVASFTKWLVTWQPNPPVFSKRGSSEKLPKKWRFFSWKNHLSLRRIITLILWTPCPKKKWILPMDHGFLPCLMCIKLRKTCSKRSCCFGVQMESRSQHCGNTYLHIPWLCFWLRSLFPRLWYEI